MKKGWRIFLIVLGAIVLLLLFGPFLVPVPPLVGTLPPEQLADPDSRFVEVNGIRVHYKMAGRGEPTLVLLHGFAASTYSWAKVMPALAEHGTVIAFDRPSSGLTERPLSWSGESPYSVEAMADLTVGLLDALGVEKAVLVGHSAGGTVAVVTALRHPERVQGLVLVDPAVYTTGGPGSSALLRLILQTPQANHLGPLLVRSIQSWGENILDMAWHDPARITAADREGYRKPLQAENWDRGLWELTRAARDLDLAGRLHEIAVPTLVITGDDDRIVPPADSVRLAGEIHGARLAIIPDCGHIPQEEQPEAFLGAILDFLTAAGPSTPAPP